MEQASNPVCAKIAHTELTSNSLLLIKISPLLLDVSLNNLEQTIYSKFVRLNCLTEM